MQPPEAGTATIPPPVAATASSAAFCKWSLFRRGYLDALGLPPEMLALLAALAGVHDDHHETPSARPTPSASPLAHRCYHLRAAVVGEVLRRTWARTTGCAVVVLGAGMDGLALALLAQAVGQVNESGSTRAGGTKCLIEVDCPEVVAKKRAAFQRLSVAAAPGASSWLGPLVDGQQHRCYHLVAADLRDPEGSVARALAPLFSGAEKEEGEEVFVLEAVLGYLPPERATALLRWIAADFPRAAVLVVDTGRVASLGADAVAQSVVQAFAARGCPLDGLKDWAADGPSTARALRQWGFPHVWPSDLWNAGAALVPPERLLLPSIPDDVFDEYAAWELFARQSLVAVAATASAGPLFHALTCPPPPSPSPASSSSTLAVARHAAALTALEARVAALEAEEEGGRERRRREAADAMDLPPSHCSSSAASPAAAAILTIRCFQPRDAPAVRALVASGRAGAARGRPAVTRFLRKALEGDVAEMEARYAGGERFWVMVAQQAQQDGVVGCVGLRLAGNGGTEHASSSEGEIVRLTVADGWHRQGIGRRLLRHAEAHAKGACKLALLRATTLDETALPGACALYVSEGYNLEQRQPFKDGELLHLVKRL